MISDLSASDIANEISMMRSAFKGTYLVVEGITDCRLFSKFIDGKAVKVMIAHSKDNVRRSVGECRGKRRDNKVVGIVDKDIDGMLGKKHSPPIFVTDKHDIESMILNSNAMNDVLTEYGDRERLERFEAQNGKVGNVLANSSCPIGALMYISYKRGMNLSFKDLDHARFVNPRTLSTDVSRMVSEVYANSMGQMYPKAAIADQVRGIIKELEDPWDAVRGHDAVDILVIGLRECFGSYNAKYIKEGELGGALRLAYSYTYFKKTGLYASSDAWCRENGLALWISRRFP